MNLSRVLIGLCLCGLLYSACGSGNPKAKTVTYFSADHAYRFNYRPALLSCAPGAAKSRVEPSCRACGASDGNWESVACYEFSKFRINDMDFVGSSAVAQTIQEVTKQSCLDAKKGEVKQEKDRVVRGVPFKVFHRSPEATSATEEWDIYRAYRSGTCYQITIWKSWTKPGNFHPENYEKYKRWGLESLDEMLGDPLRTFEFTK